MFLEIVSFVAAVGHERKTAATIEPYDAILVPCDLVPCFFASTRTWLGSVMQMGSDEDVNFPSALLQAK